MVECLHKQVFKKMKEVNIAVIFAIFKITMSFNVFVAMDAPFHMKLFEIWLWRTLEAFHISRHWNFQTNKYYKGASVGISERWTNLFHRLF